MVIDYPIPNNMTGLLIGKSGENLKKLMARTKALIHIPKAPEHNSTERIIQIKGSKEQVDAVKREIALLTSNSTFGTKGGPSATLLREKQQAVAAIQMYLPPYCLLTGSHNTLDSVGGEAKRPDDKKEKEKVVPEIQKQQQIRKFSTPSNTL